ncbi:MAG: phosphoribosylanthranilate isomerase [Mariprofundaceae bacterium]|nr:phosphoribosylanthranilate isomerase [Mariprofundaceae bacterium]
MSHQPNNQQRTRIKVCGITRIEDALTASRLGVDAVGFVFYPKSPRYISPMQAAKIIRRLPPFVSAVGLFVNPKQSEIDEVLQSCPLGVIQLHGDESPEFCMAQSRRVVKAIPVSSMEDLKRARSYPCPVLLDAKAPEGVYGGTGTSFDWSLLKNFKHDYPLILAGGLNAGNVEAALSVRQWFALDVSSGVETSPGIKDDLKLSEFIARVNSF